MNNLIKDIIGFLVVLVLFIVIIMIFDLPKPESFIIIGVIAVVNLLLYGVFRKNK